MPISPERAGTLKPGEGYIVATLATKGVNRDGKPGSAPGIFSVNAKGLEANKSIFVSMVPMVATKEPGSFANLMGPQFVGSRPSDVIAIPVPAGDYEITGWSVTGWAVTAQVMFRNRLPMKVPFRVKPGESTYVGRIHAVMINGKNLLGMPVPGGAFVIITDEYAKDSSVIASSYPAIKKTTIRNSDVPDLYRKEMTRISETPPKFFGMF